MASGGERACRQAWRPRSPGIAQPCGHSAGPAAEASWEALPGLQTSAGKQRLTLHWVALSRFGTGPRPRGPGLARRLATGPGQPPGMGVPARSCFGGVLGAPFSADAGSEPDCRLCLRLADELGCGVDPANVD